MENPISDTTPGGSTTITHKRTKSAPRIPSGPVPSSLFLTNLRLLNLDTLADWPSITPSTFSNVDARARIKAAEWSLYQLFRISDPAVTVEKLQPFFPPLEPLQSINLRAALYRCLDGLKKNGILGRDVVLRKTMLDECAGDKFWEVCVAFSATVVRKKVVGKRGKSGLGRPVAQALGTAQSLGKVDKDIMMPLMVAHRVSLSRNLLEKQILAEQFAQLGGILREKEDDMGRRRAEISRDGKGEQVQKQLEHFSPLEDVLRRGWVGDEGFEEALLSGGSAASDDRILSESTEALFDRDSGSRNSNPAQADRDLVNDIASKARGQNLRLKRWEALYDRLQAAKPKPSQAEQAKSKGDASQVRFDRHADLTVADTKPQRGFGSPTKSSHHSRGASACVAGYDNILTALREDLRLAHARRNGHHVAKDFRHGRSTSDAVTGASRPSAFQPLQPRQHSRSPSLQHSPSQSPVPFRPGMGRRISSRSRSYQQPKVISQRGPIPLKTELFSPLKSSRPGSHSPRSASISRPTSLLPSPHEEIDESMASIDHALDHQHQDRSDAIPYSNSHRPNHMLPSPQEEDDESVATIDGALAGLGLSHQGAHSDLEDSSSNIAMPTVSASPIDLDPSKQDPWKDEPEFKMTATTPASYTPRPSLAERTRLSMAFNSSGSQTPDEPSSPAIHTDKFPSSPSNNATPTPAQPTHNLVERTRQSISSFTPTTPIPRQKHTRSRTSIHQHPEHTNTPRRSSYGNLTPSQEVDGEEEEGFQPRSHQRIITPRDQLFEASAEYDSVFKSRPRVAHTPPLSSSVLEYDEDADFSMVGALKELDNEGALGSSPLGR